MLAVVYKHLINSSITFTKWGMCASCFGTVAIAHLIYERTILKLLLHISGIQTVHVRKILGSICP